MMEMTSKKFLAVTLRYIVLLSACILIICTVYPIKVKNKEYYLYSATTNSDWRRELYGGRILQILVIEDGDKFLKYWPSHEDTLRKYVPVVQRYHLTIKDLERLNWTVTYPPTEDMKGVSMWPPIRKK
ncbi:hypothetical protein [Hoylesella loescheii]|uniref:Uncharacterized protein n=1 Tax=Hoylesella loescheii DSM 19665 = JCM 12249 = ATCC 15930 TaxID=1122985 RepID=A0A069QR51_HOYLO|nr:hypothetical protein [Hoylesella loescheii]KDR52311.1 hypothetical protein HMPREF1991_01616 [Hoylesella loescheii DSM 19665 = JCM 12249 = ATCC 15930]